MDYQAAKFWLEIAIFAFNVCLWVYVWRSNKDKATNNRIEKLEADIRKSMSVQGEKISRMDERLKNAVGHPELKPLYERVNSMAADISEMRGKMHTLDLIHEMMLNGGK